jgi:hypothetical protein
MEFLLGVSEEEDPRAIHSTITANAEVGATRYDVDDADALDQDEGKQLARHRYQHMFWEAVSEGEVRLISSQSVLLFTVMTSRNRSWLVSFRNTENS